MRTLLSEVRSALTGYDDLTDLVPASKITFARRPQRDELPGMTFAIGTVDYDETVQSYAASTTYRIDVTVYAASADSATQIHDQVKLALLAATSNNFRIRISDERYFVDVDNNHMAFISCTWQHNAGGTDPSTATFLSSAFQGHDHMKIVYLDDLTDNGQTTLSLSEQAYSLNLIQHGSQLSHTLNLPSSEENQGKIYTFFTDDTFDNNSQVRLMPHTGESVQEEQAYDLDRAEASVTIVACKSSVSDFGWRIIAYQGLHD